MQTKNIHPWLTLLIAAGCSNTTSVAPDQGFPGNVDQSATIPDLGTAPFDLTATPDLTVSPDLARVPDLLVVGPGGLQAGAPWPMLGRLADHRAESPFVGA